MEIWKEIKGYEGLYEVSSEGRVRKLIKGNYLTFKNSNGYQRVGLCIHSKQKWFLVHRLVAQAFIPNPDNKPEVDHINCDRNDNIVENLRWVTSKENNNNPITRKNKSDCRIGIPKSDEHRKKLSLSKIGKHPSQETREKMSISHRGNKSSRGMHWKIINNKRVYY